MPAVAQAFGLDRFNGRPSATENRKMSEPEHAGIGT
jgi:hypothetical protein